MNRQKCRPLADAPRKPVCEMLEPRAYLSVTPSVISTSLPNSIVSGTTQHGSVLVDFVNNGSTTDQGTFKVEVFASDDGVMTEIGHGRGFRVLGAGDSGDVDVAVIVHKTLGVGSYELLAEVTDPLGSTSTSTSGPTFAVVPAVIDLSDTVSIVAPPSSQVLPGKSCKLAVEVTNNGNTKAIGPLTIDFSFSANPDGSDPQMAPTKIRHLGLAAGAETVFRISERVAVGTTPDPYFVAADIDPNDTFNETDLANNTAVTPTELTVLPPYPVLLDQTYSGPFKVRHGTDKGDTVEISLHFTAESQATGALTASGVETIGSTNFDFSFVGAITPKGVFTGSTSNTLNSDVARYHGRLVGTNLSGTFSNTNGDSGTFDMDLTV